MRLIYSIVLLLGLSSSVVLGQDSNKLSADFHKNRRIALRKEMPKNSVAVFFASAVKNRSNDVNYIYHQDPDFYYLTGLKETASVLLMFSDNQKDATGKTYNEILYVRDKDPQFELWNGELLGVHKAQKTLEINTLSTSDFMSNPLNFKTFNTIFVSKIKVIERVGDANKYSLSKLKEKFKQLSGYDELLSETRKKYYTALVKMSVDNPKVILSKVNESIKQHPELRKDYISQAFKSAVKKADYTKVMKRLKQALNNKTRINTSFLTKELAKLREVKTSEELVLLKKAIDISVIGQIEMMKAMRPNISEREIQGVHEFVYKKYGAAYEGYPSIVGGGNNGCVLHYIKNDKPHIKDGELVLMDLGAEYEAYTADITRTIPTNGKFTKAQKAIYNVVLKAQSKAIKVCLVGAPFFKGGKVARAIINKGLSDLGIIKTPQTPHNYFPHGASHYLGLDVHDLGTYGSLKHNSVITVEPGIYIPEGSPCDKKWWGIAIRIEDDILITDKGPINLSIKAPKTIRTIEKMMRTKSVLKDWMLPKLD